MLRYKGVLSIEGQPNRMIFQGVHMLMGGTPGKPWAADEIRESKMVFIGRNLPKRIFVEGLAYCVTDNAKTAIEIK
jgi:G3E family GTPase